MDRPFNWTTWTTGLFALVSLSFQCSSLLDVGKRTHHQGFGLGVQNSVETWLIPVTSVSDAGGLRVDVLDF